VETIDLGPLGLYTIGGACCVQGGARAGTLAGLGALDDDAARAAGQAALDLIDALSRADGAAEAAAFEEALYETGDPALSEFLAVDIVEAARRAIDDLREDGDDPELYDRLPSARLGAARALAARVASGAITEFEVLHSGMDEAQWAAYRRDGDARRAEIERQIAKDQPSLFAQLYMSKAGDVVIYAGSAVTGATGFNQAALDAAQATAAGRDAALSESGEAAGATVAEGIGEGLKAAWDWIPWWAKLGAVAAVGGAGFVAYRTVTAPVRAASR